jgi:hypothetical protein
VSRDIDRLQIAQLTFLFFRDKEYESFVVSYNTAVKSFVFLLIKMMIKKGSVDYDTIHKMYSKVDIENFIDS